MKKCNLEKKIDLAIQVLTRSLTIDERYLITSIDVMRFNVVQAISILCMTDDFCVEEKTTYYCLSEIERNLNSFVEERKRKENENGNK